MAGQHAAKQMFVRIQYPGEEVLGKTIKPTDLDNVLKDIHKAKICEDYECTLGARLVESQASSSVAAGKDQTDSGRQPQASAQGDHVYMRLLGAEQYYCKTLTLNGDFISSILVEIYVDNPPPGGAQDNNTMVGGVKQAILHNLIGSNRSGKVKVCIMNFFIGKS